MKKTSKWKCEPCGHLTDEKPTEICLICGSRSTGAVKIVSQEGEIKHIGRGKTD